MYIRTSCGVLGILKHIKLNMYEFNNERYIKNGIRLHNSNHDYSIKSQGEELINILRIGDLLLGEHIEGFLIFSAKDYQANELLGAYINAVDKVITNEQYMKLIQEV